MVAPYGPDHVRSQVDHGTLP